MKVLVVYCHPVPESFCAAIRDKAVEILSSRHDVRLVDLHAEGFDPVMRCDERRDYNNRPPADPALAPHIENLKWAEAMVVVYPTWWYGLPAMLKGWLDRVWATGVAFDLDPVSGKVTPRMTHIRKIAVLTTCGAPYWWSFMVGQPGRKTILRGIRALCAPRCKSLYLAHYKMDASTNQSRESFLSEVGRKLSRF
jgi:putative NADPH-quinone reductase